MELIFRRIEHFTWANFAYTIAGGGTASVLANIPFRFDGLTIIGDIVFLYNFTVFCVFHACIITRFIRRPRLFIRSITHRIESQFVPTYFMTWSTVLMNMELYARKHTGVWLPKVLNILFWVYVGACSAQTLFQYSYVFLSHKMTFNELGPAILFLCFPLMLSGTIAANFVNSQPQSNALTQIIGGTMLQLLGFNISLLIDAILIFKFMTKGLPEPSARPGLFIMVGPIAYTGFSILLLGEASETVFPPNFISKSSSAGAAFAMIGVYQALICWGLCLWLSLIALVTILHGAIYTGMRFKLTWCALVFPPAGLTLLTIKLGEILECGPLMWVGTIMGIFVCAAYILCTVSYYEAILSRRIMVSGKDEDSAPEKVSGLSQFE